MCSSRLLSYVSVALLLAGCSAPATPSRTEAPARSSGNAPSMSAPTATVGVSDRPLPHPVVPPRAYTQAVARGTRTRDGRPGPNYWQQQARYTLEARLFPEAKRLEGAARIRYTNHSPDTLRILLLKLLDEHAHSPFAGEGKNVLTELWNAERSGRRFPRRAWEPA